MSQLSEKDYSLQKYIDRSKEIHGEEKEVDVKFIKQLAIDIVDNKVFCSYMINNTYIKSIFVALYFANADLIPYDVEMFYEYYDKACPRSINGYPIFFSFGYLRKKEYQLLLKEVVKYSDFKLEYMNG